MSSSRPASATTCSCIAEEGVLFQPCAVRPGTWCSPLADLRVDRVRPDLEVTVDVHRQAARR